MTLDLVAFCLDATDPLALASYWAGVLGRELDAGPSGPDGPVTLLPSDDTGFAICFLPTSEQKVGLNRMHLDLTSTSVEDQQQTVIRSLELGGRPLDVGQLPEEGHVVLADPEGNEYCVTEPGNSFLAGCGLVGALSCDGSREVGHFWSAALGWPLVWDQDEETAIQSPLGGPKIAWGGPPVNPRTGQERVHLDVAASVRAEQHTEVERLVSLGARWIGTGRAETSVTMADPDGNLFCVVGHRR